MEKMQHSCIVRDNREEISVMAGVENMFDDGDEAELLKTLEQTGEFDEEMEFEEEVVMMAR